LCHPGAQLSSHAWHVENSDRPTLLEPHFVSAFVVHVADDVSDASDVQPYSVPKLVLQL